jgi:hypothetical protein
VLPAPTHLIVGIVAETLQIAQEKIAFGTVHADDVAGAMANDGLNYADLGNAAGSVFDCSFQWTGQVIRSLRPSTHGRIVRVWRLKCDT